MQTGFGHHLSTVQAGSEVIVTGNGKEVGRLIPKEHVVSYLTDTLTGILHGCEDMGRAKEERLREKDAAID